MERYWEKRFEDPLADAESLIMDDKKRILDIGQREDSVERIQAQYMGLIKFSARGVDIFKKAFLRARNLSHTDTCPWGGQNRKFSQLYMTDMLQGLVDEGQDVFAVPVHRGWFEIDTAKDYEIAKQEFRDQMLR